MYRRILLDQSRVSRKENTILAVRSQNEFMRSYRSLPSRVVAKDSKVISKLEQHVIYHEQNIFRRVH